MYNILLTAGGGEILQYIGNDSSNKKEFTAMDNSIIQQLGALSGVKILIMLLLIVVAILIVLKIMEVRSPFRGKAITSELDNLDKLKKHDDNVIRANKTIASLTKIVEMFVRTTAITFFLSEALIIIISLIICIVKHKNTWWLQSNETSGTQCNYKSS